MLSHTTVFQLITSYLCVTNSVLLGAGVTESHIIVTCFGVAAPENACYENTRILTRSKQHCVARCERESTCLGIFMRLNDGEKLVDCVLSQIMYRCSELQQVRGGYNYADAAQVNPQQVRRNYNHKQGKME